MKTVKTFEVFSLNENLPQETDFKNEITNLDCTHTDIREYLKRKGIMIKLIPSHDIDVEDINLSIFWKFSLDLRSYGIKSIDISIKNVNGKFDIITLDEHEKEIPYEIDFDANKEGFQIISDIKVEEDGAIRPSSVYIDFNEKSVTVS